MGTSLAQAKTAAAIALFLVGIWVLALVARPLTPLRVGLVTSMAGGGVLFLGVGYASRLFSLVVPPVPVFAAIAAIVCGTGAILWVTFRWVVPDDG